MRHRRAGSSRVSWLVAGALANTILTASVVTAAERVAGHYLVFEVDGDGSVQPVVAAPVALVAGRGGGTVVPARARRDDAALSVRLTDPTGAVVFEDVQALPRWLRSEAPAEALGDGAFAIDSHPVPVGRQAFVVRVPDVPGARLSLQSDLLPRSAELRLDAVIAESRVAALADAPTAATPLVRNGDPANRLDLLIVGEGYTSAERSKFDGDAANLANGFFAIAPLQEYRNYVNVSTLFVASPQSGADQPRYDPACTESAPVQTCCSDQTAIGTVPTMVNTAFDATFCSYNAQRALILDDAKVFAAAAAEPDWDKIIVLVNSSVYGATGGVITVVSTSGQQNNVAQHEHGHSFGLLADEYDDPFPAFPPCSDVNAAFLDCEPNVTDQTNRSSIKWRRWISPSQPIPSFAAPPVETAAGLWQGARYLGTGMYRQGFSCLMRFLGTPFCDVAAEAMTARFYQGGWGQPATGVDNIEPGTEDPPPGAVGLSASGRVFGATLLGPQAGPALAVEWRVDDVAVLTDSVVNGARASFTLATTPGAHAVELRVTDVTPFIHETIRASFTSTRRWDVTVGTGTATCGDADGSGSVTVTDGVQTLRAAAALSSACTLARCDVDGNGVLSVTDGVNVLRTAAGLPAAASCPLQQEGAS